MPNPGPTPARMYRFLILFCVCLLAGFILLFTPFARSEEHTSELQPLRHLVCRLLLEKKYSGTVVRHRSQRSCDELAAPPFCDGAPVRAIVRIRATVSARRRAAIIDSSWLMGPPAARLTPAAESAAAARARHRRLGPVGKGRTPPRSAGSAASRRPAARHPEARRRRRRHSRRPAASRQRRPAAGRPHRRAGSGACRGRDARTPPAPASARPALRRAA